MELLITVIEDALPSIASGVVIGFVAYIASKLKSGGVNVKTFMNEHRELVEQQTKNTETLESFKERFDKLDDTDDEIKSVLRNDVKSHLVSIYERAVDRGSISQMELETVNRLNDSYHNTLHGNTYIHVIVKRMNNMPIEGEEIPAH